ncbi:hypothetical protein RhiirA5_378468 [Rhizophagus irregularis]|uniref:Uncharacterized protein n=1 Tax=Rhizophagus irregularis TaxID=588596 RepID=A0A2N0PFQ5_9GLOM|nr:hypothetical protein RhiirA5_378468 [Rhizophagus irregularis]
MYNKFKNLYTPSSPNNERKNNVRKINGIMKNKCLRKLYERNYNELLIQPVIWTVSNDAWPPYNGTNGQMYHQSDPTFVITKFEPMIVCISIDITAFGAGVPMGCERCESEKKRQVNISFNSFIANDRQLKIGLIPLVSYKLLYTTHLKFK